MEQDNKDTADTGGQTPTTETKASAPERAHVPHHKLGLGLLVLAAVIVLLVGAYTLWGDALMERCFGDSCAVEGTPEAPFGEGDVGDVPVPAPPTPDDLPSLPDSFPVVESLEEAPGTN
jgi:hypothetical protein